MEPTLLQAAQLLLIAVKNQEITIFPNADNTADYINILEKAVNSESERKRIFSAGHYLSDGDLSTVEMIKAIEEHEDQMDLIDNVEGVEVWEKLEGSLTCEQFLEMISI
jgi:hypothetical protein